MIVNFLKQKKLRKSHIPMDPISPGIPASPVAPSSPFDPLRPGKPGGPVRHNTINISVYLIFILQN